ncbi:MAG: hypothetical protein J3K34DRAFT_511039 [Monoraphidium minutum]|nr:MAG: hypothetical protein J3K34DRAFT_511039 [Monoraphidium minutum]
MAYTCKPDWCGCTAACVADPPEDEEQMFQITSFPVDESEAPTFAAKPEPVLFEGAPKTESGAPGDAPPATDGRVYKGTPPAAGAPGSRCRPGVTEVRCLADPCGVNKCGAGEKCVSDYCGGCNFVCKKEAAPKDAARPAITLKANWRGAGTLAARAAAAVQNLTAAAAPRAAAAAPPADAAACAAGHAYSAAVKACAPCRAGTFADPTLNMCRSCKAGHFSKAQGAGSCSPCPAGSFVPIRGARMCLRCPPGLTSAAGAAGCRRK